MIRRRRKILDCATLLCYISEKPLTQEYQRECIKQFSFVLFCLSLAWLLLIIAFVKNTAGVGDVTMLGMYYVSKDPRDCLVCPPANPPPFKLVFLSPFHSLLTTAISTASSSRLWLQFSFIVIMMIIIILYMSKIIQLINANLLIDFNLTN